VLVLVSVSGVVSAGWVAQANLPRLAALDGLRAQCEATCREWSSASEPAGTPIERWLIRYSMTVIGNACHSVKVSIAGLVPQKW